jgi:2'-5' RNA ligase
MVVKRVFLALPLEPVEPAAERMKLLQKQLSYYRIKWIRIENFHLTLFFFGETSLKQILVLQELLRSTLKNYSAFSFVLDGPGIFKKGREPRVLWLGIKPSDKLFEIKRAVNNVISTSGFPPDDKFYRPHLTLGRFLPGQEISSITDDVLKDALLKAPVEYYVSKLILFESILCPEGAQYYPIEVYNLTSNSGFSSY